MAVPRFPAAGGCDRVGGGRPAPPLDARDTGNVLNAHVKMVGMVSSVSIFYHNEKKKLRKATYCRIPTPSHSGKGNIMEPVKRSAVTRS